MSGSNFPVNSGPEHRSPKAIRLRYEESRERSAFRRDEALRIHRRRMRRLRMVIIAMALLFAICVAVVVMSHTR